MAASAFPSMRYELLTLPGTLRDRKWSRELGVVLRKIRVAAGLNQGGLAQRLYRGQAFVSKYETGKQDLTFEDLIEVCAALDVRLEEVIGRLPVEEP